MKLRRKPSKIVMKKILFTQSGINLWNSVRQRKSSFKKEIDKIDKISGDVVLVLENGST